MNNPMALGTNNDIFIFIILWCRQHQTIKGALFLLLAGLFLDLDGVALLHAGHARERGLLGGLLDDGEHLLDIVGLHRRGLWRGPRVPPPRHKPRHSGSAFGLERRGDMTPPPLLFFVQTWVTGCAGFGMSR